MWNIFSIGVRGALVGGLIYLAS